MFYSEDAQFPLSYLSFFQETLQAERYETAFSILVTVKFNRQRRDEIARGIDGQFPALDLQKLRAMTSRIGNAIITTKNTGKKFYRYARRKLYFPTIFRARRQNVPVLR